MPKKDKSEVARIQTNALTADEAEALFATVDETGHTNEESAARQRRHRQDTGAGVDVDPLADVDPSGSNVGKTIAKAAVAFVVIFFVVIVGLQVITGYIRRESTANLSEEVNVRNVAAALDAGVEWGNGFTQYPQDFSVQEADENTGRVEVTVIDTTSENALEALAGSQIQATAFSVNCLLNKNINTVIYHVNVHEDEDGNIEKSSFFGFFRPSGDIKPFMTFIWTKTTTSEGDVRFNCTISGLDDDLQDALREQITTRFTPQAIINVVTGNSNENANANTNTNTNGNSNESASSSANSTSSDANASSGETDTSGTDNASANNTNSSTQ